MRPKSKLIFVYNADTGLFNTMSDIAHKIFSPHTYACNLCKLTYGWLSERSLWREFLDSLDADCEFLHRDQFQARYPGTDIDLPAVLRLDQGSPSICIDAKTLNGLTDIQALAGAIAATCAQADAG